MDMADSILSVPLAGCGRPSRAQKRPVALLQRWYRNAPYSSNSSAYASLASLKFEILQPPLASRNDFVAEQHSLLAALHVPVTRRLLLGGH